MYGLSVAAMHALKDQWAWNLEMTFDGLPHTCFPLILSVSLPVINPLLVQWPHSEFGVPSVLLAETSFELRANGLLLGTIMLA